MVHTISGLGGCGVAEEPVKSRDSYMDDTASNTDKEITYQVRVRSWDQTVVPTLLDHCVGY